MCGWHAQNRVRNCGTKNQPTRAATTTTTRGRRGEEAKKRTSCSIICRQSRRAVARWASKCHAEAFNQAVQATHTRPLHLPPCVRHWLSANRQCPVHICQKETEREGTRETEREIGSKGNTERELVVVALVALKTVLATHTHTHAGKTEIETV